MPAPECPSLGICVIGSINMDLVVRTPRFVTPGETLTANSWCTVPGGKGANQAVAAARLGAKVSFCGCLGDDGFGAQLREGLRREGIDVSKIRSLEKTPTGIALIAVEASGRNAIYVVGGANHLIDLHLIEDFESAVCQSKMLLLQLEIPLEVTLSAIKMAKEQGVPVLLDPAPALSGPLPDALFQVDLISPNEFEAEMLTGIQLSDLANAKMAAEQLARRGAKEIVIKLGDRGAVARDRLGVTSHIASAPVKVVDTTAAGDAFTASLSIAYWEGRSLVEATQYACAAGAFSVGREGAQPSMPTRGEVERVMAKYAFPVSSI